MDDIRLLAPVSVIVPCYRCLPTIKRALESVFNQTWRPAEVVLVEDFSEDGTLDALYELQKSYPTGWIRIIPLSKNQGPSIARNTGWDSSTQDFIAFLDSDDSWHNKKIEVQLGFMLENSEVFLTGSIGSLADRFNPDSPLSDSFKFKKITKYNLLFSNRFLTPSVIVRREITLRFNAFKRHSEDYLLWLEVLFKYQQCYLYGGVLTFIHKDHYGVSGLSQDIHIMEQGELENYDILYRDSRISKIEHFIFKSISYVKYIRRIFLVKKAKI
ncbi:glycosyltransferase family 2 protein [Idiomarina abyssalis]|uniref:glycosyltransferase family 2 protein n=1 Tax=Idiomarina abyssalis TaxID=86102 RepID=UPI003A905E44